MRDFADSMPDKRAEEALRESRGKLALALRSAGMGAWRLDVRNGKRVFDGQVCRCLGIDPARFAGTAEEFYAAVHPEDHARVKAALEETIASGVPYEVEYRAVWPDGSVHHIAARGQLARDGTGQGQRIDGLVWEVTERKRAETRLLQLNRTLTAHSETSRALLAAEDEAAYLKQVCRTIAEDCGHAMVWIGFAEEDPGKTIRPVASAGLEQGYLDTLRLTWADAERGRGPTGTAIRTGQPSMCRDMRADPHMAPWRTDALERGYGSSLALPLVAAERAFGAVTIYSGQRDAFSDEEVELLGKLAGEVAHGIQLLRLRQAHQDAEEALRLSEEKFALAFANNPAAISMTVLEDGRFVDVNDTWQGLMGYQREEVLGRSARQMGIWPTPEAAARYVKELREKGSLRGWEQEFQTRSGQTFVAQLAAQVLTIGGEKVVLSTLVDITRRKRAEEAVRRSEERLERLVAERTAKLQELVGELEHFSYTITHDMRAPLRAMRGFSEAVLEMCADCAQEKQRDFLRRIMAGADRMDALIRDALNYSRAVRQELPQETVDVAKLLRGMLESYPELNSSRARIRIEGEMPLVLGNQAGLIQCLSNLLNNAVKFVPRGQTPEIRIWAERRQGWVRVSVQDNGIGISETMLPRVFEMFSRGHRTYEGTGIGLALVRKVMQRMGGKVGVESQEGRGSRFWLELPATGDARQTDPA